MSYTDPIGDLLSRIRNAQGARLTSTSSPSSNLRVHVLEVLKREGYIRDFKLSKGDHGQAEVNIELKYFDGQPVIREVSRVSTPGRRVYTKISELPRVYNGLGISILSTPRGVMSDKEARAANVGGEVLCQVF